MLDAYSYAVEHLNINSITHKFLIHGHSQNEGDNVHSVIEKNVRKHIRSGPIYVPDKYSTLIRTAKKTGMPYSVHELSYDDFYDLKTLPAQLGKNFNINTEKSKFHWHDIKMLRVDKQSPRKFFFKTSYEDQTYKTVNMKNSTTTRHSLETPGCLELPKAYTSKFPLADNKKKDIQELVDKKIIPT